MNLKSFKMCFKGWRKRNCW